MSDFKVGDEVWYMGSLSIFTHHAIEPTDIFIKRLVVRFILNKLYVCVDDIPGLEINKNLLYKSKQECIDAFKKRLDEL